MNAPLYALSLTIEQQRFVRSCFAEISSGGSTDVIQRAFGHPTLNIQSLKPHFETDAQLNISLTEIEWRSVYDLIHATIYGLGQFELATLTGFDLQDAVNMNLMIASKIWGAYGESRF
ncbi:hypothetical protein [Pseudosulfitobacter sp. SM2401]|uniref:hypothetical protein n=1 Tax=Pseudosulfitobacter sp. SM2401 TaxID=3350098 RepID=UPI0036F22296